MDTWLIWTIDNSDQGYSDLIMAVSDHKIGLIWTILTGRSGPYTSRELVVLVRG